MKKLILAVIATTLLVSCGGKKGEKESSEGDNLPVQSSELLEQPVSDGHNARNSLDYEGTYKGVLPTASGEGMEITLVVMDSTYTRTSVYITPGDTFIDEGKYVWNDAGTTITLEGAEPANQYFVGENILFTLDMEGNRVESELAEHYNLTKVE